MPKKALRMSVYIEKDLYDELVDLGAELQKKRNRNVGISEVLCCSAQQYLDSTGENTVKELLRVVH